MKERYSVREAAAIAEVSPETIRTALEKRTLRPSHKHRAGKAVRYGFSVRDVLLMKLFTEFPFPLGKDDKDALKAVLLRRAKTANRWRVAGPDLVFSSGQVEVIVQCKHIRRRLAHNIATFHWGKRRIVRSPKILSGEPAFRGTRIPLEHIAGLFRKAVDEREIAEDFPQLGARDLAYAKLYARLGPRPGRPKRGLQIRRKRKVA